MVDQVLAELGANEKPLLHVFNKIDAVEHDVLMALQERVHNLLPNSIFVSTLTDDGLEPLRRALQTAVRQQLPVSTIRLPLSDGRLLAELHRNGEVLSQTTDDDAIVVTARVDEALAGRLRQGGAVVSV